MTDSHQSINTTTLSTSNPNSNPPADFSLQIGYAANPINIIRFYDNSIRALVSESTKSWLASSSGS